MNQDAMFFVIATLIVVGLMLIGPGLVVWQYQRGPKAAVPGKRPETVVPQSQKVQPTPR
jgi:hypothetical protein